MFGKGYAVVFDCEGVVFGCKAVIILYVVFIDVMQCRFLL